jgi:ATPase family AAA domain-containing protein 1
MLDDGRDAKETEKAPSPSTAGPKDVDPVRWALGPPSPQTETGTASCAASGVVSRGERSRRAGDGRLYCRRAAEPRKWAARPMTPAGRLHPEVDAVVGGAVYSGPGADAAGGAAHVTPAAASANEIQKCCWSDQKSFIFKQNLPVKVVFSGAASLNGVTCPAAGRGQGWPSCPRQDGCPLIARVAVRRARVMRNAGSSLAGGSGGGTTRTLEFVLAELFTAGVGVLAVWLGAHVMRRVLDPAAEGRERARARREAVVNRLLKTGVDPRALVGLSPTEECLLHDLVFPEDIAVSFAHIGGLDEVKESLREIIVYPMLYPDLFGLGRAGAASPSPAPGAGKLLSPPKGVLLYGPPGTGKSCCASALAKESGANFLALSPSSMLSKWLGETEQLARAVFSLARRVAPTIVFIDEIDGLFRERSSSEHEAHKNLKSEFMQMWDGLATDDCGAMVVVLGATNRPYDVDPAILRRMPRAFEVGLPSPSDRVAILRKLMSDADLEPAFSFERVAEVTEGYSGSDLKELCRAAMMQPVREALRVTAKAARIASESGQDCRSTIPEGATTRLRPLALDDVLQARADVTRTEAQSQQYLLRSAVATRKAQQQAVAAVSFD